MYKILLIDKEYKVIDDLKSILTDYIVEAVSHWQSIPKKIQTFAPDLLLLNISLGDEDRKVIYHYLKDINENAQISILIFSARYKLTESIKNFKPNKIIIKPFLLTSLIDNLN